jgi:hypothetical protein
LLTIEQMLEEAKGALESIEERLPVFPEETVSKIERGAFPATPEDMYEARYRLGFYIDGVRHLIVELQESRDILRKEEHNELFFKQHIDTAITTLRALMLRASAARIALREKIREERKSINDT